MKKISQVLTVAALATLSVGAIAADCSSPRDAFGFADRFDRDFGPRFDNAGFPEFPGRHYSAAPVLTEEQQKAIAEQQRLMAEQAQQAFAEQQRIMAEQQQVWAEQQAKAYQQAMEAQRIHAEQQAKAYQEAMEAQRQQAEQFAANAGQYQLPTLQQHVPFDQPFPFEQPFQFEQMPFEPAFGSDRMPFEAPDFAALDAQAEEFRKQMDERMAQFDAMRPMPARFAEPRFPRHEMSRGANDCGPAARPTALTQDREARRAEMQKLMEERRSQVEAQRVARPVIRDNACRDDVKAKMQQRREEMMKRVEEQRAAVRKS